jgi:hypothetical protein
MAPHMSRASTSTARSSTLSQRSRRPKARRIIIERYVPRSSSDIDDVDRECVVVRHRDAAGQRRLCDRRRRCADRGGADWSSRSSSGDDASWRLTTVGVVDAVRHIARAVVVAAVASAIAGQLRAVPCDARTRRTTDTASIAYANRIRNLDDAIHLTRAFVSGAWRRAKARPLRKGARGGTAQFISSGATRRIVLCQRPTLMEMQQSFKKFC